jgi:tetrahydromethanopterin S-methyltransferase subunit B
MTHAQRNQKILDAIAEETERALSSKKAARDTLIKEGIYTTKGKLRAEFGGSSKKVRVAA